MWARHELLVYADWLRTWLKLFNPIRERCKAKPKQRQHYFWHSIENCSIEYNLVVRMLYGNQIVFNIIQHYLESNIIQSKPVWLIQCDNVGWRLRQAKYTNWWIVIVYVQTVKTDENGFFIRLCFSSLHMNEQKGSKTDVLRMIS